MKRYLVVCLFVVAPLLAPRFAKAQSSGPPPCCEGGGGGGAAPLASTERGPKASSLHVTTDMLRSTGLSRSRLIDRLIQGIFPNRDVELLYTSTRTVGTPSRDGRIRPAGNRVHGIASDAAPLAIQERYIYQVPRIAVTDDQINELEEIYITDGTIYMRVVFEP